MRRNASQYEVRWQLPDNVPNCPCDNDVVVLVTVELKILFHAGDESVGNVRGVNPLDKHAESAHGK